MQGPRYAVDGRPFLDSPWSRPHGDLGAAHAQGRPVRPLLVLTFTPWWLLALAIDAVNAVLAWREN
jgi:hypothetical protein